MADWIWYAAEEKGIQDIEIDIINRTVLPKELEFNAVVAQLPELEKTIDKTLESNSFPKGFIVEAKMLIYISQKYKVQRLLSCTGLLKDKDGKIYEGKPITEKAYEKKPFKTYPKTITEQNERIVVSQGDGDKKWWEIWKK